MALPPFDGYTASYVVPPYVTGSAAPAGTTTSVVVSTVAPADAAAPQAIGAGSVKKRSATSAASTPAVLLYAQETFSQAFVWSSFATWTIAVPSTVTSSGLTLEIFDGTSQALLAAANGTANGQTVTFQFSTPGGMSVAASHPYVVELVSGSGLNLSYRPNGNGDAFTYSGTLTQTFVRPPVTESPTPNPNPSSSQTLTAAVTTTVGIVSGATFNGVGNLTDFHAVESDAYTSTPQTLGSTIDQYLNFVPHGASTQVMEVGSKVVTSNGVTTTTTYGNGNGLLDVIPEAAGPITPANTAALTTDEVDADGQTTTQAVNADGSYIETTNYPGGFTSAATENSDGTGNYSVPLSEFPNTVLSYGAVSNNAIPITVMFPAGLVAAGPVTQTLAVGDWYPATPPVLYTQTYANAGAVAPPTACAVPASLAKPTNQLVQTTSTVDIVFGETETETVTSYDAQGLGVVCMQLRDTTLQYYDFTGQSQSALTFSSTPVQTTTLAETLTLQTATVTDTTAAARATAFVPVARALTGGFQALVVHERAVRHAADLKKSGTLLRSQLPLVRVSH